MYDNEWSKPAFYEEAVDFVKVWFKYSKTRDLSGGFFLQQRISLMEFVIKLTSVSRVTWISAVFVIWVLHFVLSKEVLIVDKVKWS